MTSAWQLADGLMALMTLIVVAVGAGHWAYDRWRYRRAIRRYRRGGRQ